MQDLLGEYDGTVLLVSHDRDFLDRVASTTIAMEGDGRATVYAGGWSDYQSQRSAVAASVEASAPQAKQASKTAAPEPVAKPVEALSFTQKHRLETLPAEIDRLNAEIAKLEAYLAQPDLYTAEPVKFAKATEGLVERQQLLAEAEEEWLELAERAEE